MQLRNPFQVLGLPQALDISAAEIQRAFLQAMATLHPDTGSAFDGFDEERTVRAAEINLAREQLVDEASRAEALLQLRGGALLSQDKSLPEGFLSIMMEAREKLDAATEQGDARATQASLAWARTQRSQALALVRLAFTRDDLGNARRQLNACRYIDRMIEHVTRES